MNPLYEAFHERGYDLEQVGSTMVMINRKSGEPVSSLNHDDYEFFTKIGVWYNEDMIRFQISYHEFEERGFHPEAYGL
jgi:DNA phosphorothioation-dependent restriction protein DptG